MRTIIVLLAASMTLVGLPLAAADEGAPDCEPGQPLIGYRSTLFIRDMLVAQGLDDNLYVCEGEHWDGQDTVQGDQTATCAGPSVNAVPSDLFVAFCQGADPNTAPSLSTDQPLGVRAGSSNLNEVYTSVNIGGVGRAALYLGPNSAAIYLRDNTPGNVLANVVSAARITQGFPDELDCDQTTYHNGAMTPPSQCGRDNTAITIEYALP